MLLLAAAVRRLAARQLATGVARQGHGRGRRGFHAVAGPVFGEDKRERTLGGGDFDAGLNFVPNFVLDFVLDFDADAVLRNSALA